MTEQIESGSPTSPLSYFVILTYSRRVLVPDTKDGKRGYRCITFTNSGPEPQDVHVKDQTAFEKILEDMHLLSKWSPTRILGRIWPSGADGAVMAVDRASNEGEPERFETWLPLLK